MPYKFREINITTYEMLINGEPWCASFSPSCIKNIFFGLRATKRDISTVRNLLSGNQYDHIGWCQASRSEDILLWSHYAKYHTGMALGFNDEIFSDLTKRKINYQTNYVQAGYLNSDIFQVAEDVIFRKSSDWAHEKEIKIIRNPFDVKCSRHGYCYSKAIRLKEFNEFAQSFIETNPLEDHINPSEKNSVNIELSYWGAQFQRAVGKANGIGTEISFGNERMLEEVVFGAKMPLLDCHKIVDKIHKLNLGYNIKYLKCKIGETVGALGKFYSRITKDRNPELHAALVVKKK